MKKLLALLLIFVLWAFPVLAEVLVEDGVAINDAMVLVEQTEFYYTPDEVALYLHAFGDLPGNYITKNDAQKLGWVSSKGNLWDVAYGYVIGGDRFGNREGLLPDAEGRNWYECDVNYFGGFRGSERLLFSTDGLIYYTNDHYVSYTLLYDGWYEYDLEEDCAYDSAA